MKIYSEKTKKEYKTVDECLAAEKEFDERLQAIKLQEEKKNKARKDRAKEVENAYQVYLEAKENYQKLLNDFLKDYQNFHMTIKQGDPDLWVDSIFDVFRKWVS